MLTPARVWIALAVVYAAFFSWYTSFGGPLTQEEIEHFVGVFEKNGANPERIAMWRHFMENDTGDDFAIQNAIQLRETPLHVEGVEPGETSAQVLQRYLAPFLGRAFRNAAHPVYMGSAAANAVDLWGIEGADEWSTGALVRYRSRRDLMEQAEAVGPSGIHDFKIAAMEKTIAFPLDPWFHAGDPRFLLALILTILGLGYHLRNALERTRTAAAYTEQSRAA